MTARRKLIDAAAPLGAAIGLVLTRTPHAKPCATRVAAHCIGQTLGATVGTYAAHAFIGAFVALAIAATLLLAVKPRRPAVKRGRREPIPRRVRHDVWRRDGACCVDCGSRERLELDHIIPVSKGGSSTSRNLELRCERCNRSKSDRI